MYSVYYDNDDDNDNNKGLGSRDGPPPMRTLTRNAVYMAGMYYSVDA